MGEMVPKQEKRDTRFQKGQRANPDGRPPALTPSEKREVRSAFAEFVRFWMQRMGCGKMTILRALANNKNPRAHHGAGDMTQQEAESVSNHINCTTASADRSESE